MRKRIAVRWGIAAGALAALLGHFAYWYLPRERGGIVPSAEARALFADPGVPSAIWIAYPHQNLGRLERFVGDAAAWGALLAGRDRSEARRLPQFGPFVTPPASELVVTLPEGGELPSALVRAYPSIALLAKAAGRLAGNPWLAGGAVDSGGAGRAVEWKGQVWSFGRPSGVAGSAIELPSDEPAPLALLRTEASHGPLPPGTYRLVRGEAGPELRLGERIDARPALPEGPDHPAALLIERPTQRHFSIVVFWEEEGIVPPFPAAASIVRRGSPRPRLPGEEMLRLAGRRVKRESSDGLEISALSDREMERARRLLPGLLSLASNPPGASAVAVIDPAAALRMARRLNDGFAAFPLAAILGADPKRWIDLLGPWETCGPMALVVSRQGGAVRAWLCPPAAEAAR